MVIKVIGEGCDKCDMLYESTLKAVRHLGLEAEVEKVESLVEIVRLGVMATPSLMADGKLLISGRMATAKQVIKALEKHIG